MTDVSISAVDESGAMVESWISIAPPTLARTVLIVNADEVLETGSDALREIIAELPTARRVRGEDQLYFLGNPTPYPLQKFTTEGRAWLKQNSGRLPIIGPIFESMDSEGDFVGLVLTSGTVYDWQDWAGTPELQRFLRIGSRTTAASSPEDSTASTRTLGTQGLQFLQTCHPHKVIASTATWLPFFWTNAEYKWMDGYLAAEAAVNYSCIVGYLSPANQQLDVVCQDIGGDSIAMRPLATESRNEYEWLSLDEEEASVAKSCLKAGTYSCPHCHANHPANLLKCRKNNKSVLGRSVFPGLEKYKGSGFILFRERDATIEVALHRCPHLLIDNRQVAILRRGTSKVDVFAWSLESRRWQKRSDPWQQFTKVRDDVYSVVL